MSWDFRKNCRGPPIRSAIPPIDRSTTRICRYARRQQISCDRGIPPSALRLGGVGPFLLGIGQDLPQRVARHRQLIGKRRIAVTEHGDRIEEEFVEAPPQVSQAIAALAIVKLVELAGQGIYPVLEFDLGDEIDRVGVADFIPFLSLILAMKLIASVLLIFVSSATRSTWWEVP